MSETTRLNWSAGNARNSAGKAAVTIDMAMPPLNRVVAANTARAGRAHQSAT